MSSNKLNVEGILLLEQPFVKVPYENLRKTFRTSQKHIEREFITLQANSQDILKKALRNDQDTNDYVKAIDTMISRVEGLKRKLSELSTNSTAPTHVVMRKRLEYLASVENMTGRDDPAFDQWADIRLDRWLVDWALRSGNEKTARRIAEAKGIEPLVDIDLFSEIRRIEEALLAHSCTEALTWCNENKAALRKMKSTLEFDLRLQEFIELARARKTEEAIVYSKKNLVSWYDTHELQIRQASGLLAFPPTTTCTSYRRLYDSERWKVLSRTFRLAAYELSTLPTEPLLHLALYGGLSALKLPACSPFASRPSATPRNNSSSSSIPTTGSFNNSYPYSSLSFLPRPENVSIVTTPAITPTTDNIPVRNTDCPVCDPECLGQLANDVPWSHHVISTIVCRISGKIMDQDNMPMALPNGEVYSYEALMEIAAKNDGKIICPQTGETYALASLKKVYIS